MVFDYAARVQRLQALMTDGGIDVALFSIGADLPYFTGYETSPSERITVLVVRSDGAPVMFVPALEAARAPQGDFELVTWQETDDPVSMAAGLASSPSKVAVGDHMWSVFLTRFQKEWTSSKWMPASDVTTELRMRKDAMEIEMLEEAAAGIDRVMERIPLEVVFAGRSEIDVSRDLAAMTVEEGHDSSEFTGVGSGPNGASPHHYVGERIIESGDLVVCDFGGRLGGYFSDSTRTFVVGDPTEKQVEVHAVVLEANRAGREAAVAGVQCQEVDRSARRVIEEAGYGEYFIHRTGHGIGLEVHEHPYMVEGNERSLEDGMSFSVEPGIYVPDEFGVRIEDIVVCGAGSLNESDRDLVPVA